MEPKRVASWSTNAGKIVFVTPEGFTQEESAQTFDHPATMCQILDIVSTLAVAERLVLARMIVNSTLMILAWGKRK